MIFAFLFTTCNVNGKAQPLLGFSFTVGTREGDSNMLLCFFPSLVSTFTTQEEVPFPFPCHKKEGDFLIEKTQK